MPSEFIRASRRLLRRITPAPVRRALIGPDDAEARRGELRRWLKGLPAGVRIDPSISVTGRRSPYERFTVGAGAVVERDVTIWAAEAEEADPRLSLGEGCFVGRNTYLGVYAPLEIGRMALIGAYCYIISANHRFERRDVPIMRQGFTGQPVQIGEDVWVGTHAVILPGVTIGRGAVIAAGSVVNRDVGPYEIWGGVPAKFIKPRPE